MRNFTNRRILVDSRQPEFEWYYDYGFMFGFLVHKYDYDYKNKRSNDYKFHLQKLYPPHCSDNKYLKTIKYSKYQRSFINTIVGKFKYKTKYQTHKNTKINVTHARQECLKLECQRKLKSITNTKIVKIKNKLQKSNNVKPTKDLNIYCDISGLPYEYCKYSKSYLACLCSLFKLDIETFIDAINNLTQLVPLMFVYHFNHRGQYIGDDIIHLILKFVGTETSISNSNRKQDKCDRINKIRNIIAIHLKIRAHNKQMTCIRGLFGKLPFWKENDIKKVFRQEFATSVGCKVICGEKCKEVRIQGDVRYNLVLLLTKAFDISANLLFYKKKSILFNACNDEGIVLLPP
eukprot:27184_1